MVRGRFLTLILCLAPAACGLPDDEPDSQEAGPGPALSQAPIAWPEPNPPTADVLDVELDPRASRYVAEHGRPELIRRTENGWLRLIYLEQDRVASFIPCGPDSVFEQSPIPTRLRQVLHLIHSSDDAPAAEHPVQEPESGVHSGSCFAVSPDGLLLSAHHITANRSWLRVRFPDGETHLARVEAARPEIDLALLRIDAGGLTYLPLAGEARLGEPVFTIGYPAVPLLGLDPKFAEGAVSAPQTGAGHPELMMASVAVMPGNSGGPLVNASGEAVGIIVGKADGVAFRRLTGQFPENVSFAIRASQAMDLFDPPATPGPALDRRAAIDRARAASCFIESR